MLHTGMDDQRIPVLLSILEMEMLLRAIHDRHKLREQMLSKPGIPQEVLEEEEHGKQFRRNTYDRISDKLEELRRFESIQRSN